jgi:hypothetical protein
MERPFQKVLELIGKVNCKLDIGSGKHNLVHKSRLKKYLELKEEKRIGSDKLEEDEFEVEKILGKKKMHGKLYYKKFVGEIMVLKKTLGNQLRTFR